MLAAILLNLGATVVPPPVVVQKATGGGGLTFVTERDREDAERAMHEALAQEMREQAPPIQEQAGAGRDLQTEKPMVLEVPAPSRPLVDRGSIDRLEQGLDSVVQGIAVLARAEHAIQDRAREAAAAKVKAARAAAEHDLMHSIAFVLAQLDEDD